MSYTLFLYATLTIAYDVYGLAEKRRLRKLQFEETIGDYIGVRNHISACLDHLDKGRSRIVL